jgi:hypothetical protein
VATPHIKNPKRVAAGREAIRRRWPPGYIPAVVRIADLPEPQARLVLALLDAARIAHQQEAAPTIEASGAAVGGGARDANSAA